MKLHLPLGLRRAIPACCAIVFPAVLPAPAMAESVVWDANWGSTGAPTEIPAENILTALPSGFTFLSEKGSPYFSAGQTVVRLAGTEAGASGVTVIGGAGATTEKTTESEGPLIANTWLKVTGGSYATLVGGSYAQNYDGGEIASFTGDSHILLTAENGSSPVVDYIVGANYQDALSAPFTGNTYISVQGGTVNGSIVGGGTSAHIRTAIVNGNTGVWVYIPLGGTAVSRFELPGNLIVGGNAAVNNYAPRLEQAGNSRVVVDLSAYAPTGAAMEKIIVGDAWLLGNTTSTHTGDAAVEITGTAQDGSQVSFTQPVVAAAWFSGTGTASLSGSSSLTVAGGSCAASLVGGAWLANGSASGVSFSLGSSSVTLGCGLETTGSNAMVVGGSYVNAASAQLESGAHAVTLGSGSYGGAVIGGSYVAAGSGSVVESTGDVTVSLNGGTLRAGLYGGSYSARNNAESLSTHGDIRVELASGQVLGNVYAGGGVAPGAAGGVVSASTQVAVSDAVVLGSAGSSVIIWGSVQNSNASSGVQGERTLLLAGSNYANLDNVTFHDFNVVDNASAATIKLQEAARDFTKRGAGTLSIMGPGSNLNPIAELTVEAGVLDTGTAWMTRGGEGVESITVGAGASFKTDGLALVDGAALSLDISGAAGALITVGSAGGLSIGGEDRINLTLTGVESLAGGSETTLLSWGNAAAQAPFELENVTWVNKGEDMASYELAIVNQTLLLRHVEGLVWTGGSGTWNASDAWDSQSGIASDGKAVLFETPAGNAATVSISGAVAPQSVTVDNAAGSSYVFEAASAGSGMTGATSLTKNGEGTLRVELVNSCTGGTTVNGGTLDAAAVGALGSGAVLLNAGGELLVSSSGAVAVNAVEFNGGTLRYEAAETRTLDTAGVTHAAGTKPVVEVAAGTTATWQYASAAPAQAALGEGVALSGGGSLVVEGTQPSTQVALAGHISLTGSGTVLEFASPGSKQLGTEAAPVELSLAEGTTLRVERPQAGAESALYLSMEGMGTLEFAESNAAANNVVRLVGNNEAFSGMVNLGAAAEAPLGSSVAPAVVLDFRAGSPVGGAGASLNLNGLAFATVLDGGGVAATDVQVNLNRSTTQFAQTPGLTNRFGGALTGAAGSRWLLDTRSVAGGQTNTLVGNLSGMQGTLEALGMAGSVARWVLGGEGAVANPTISATLAASNEFHEFVFDCAAETAFAGAATGQANLIQQGEGTLVLTGVNTSSGRLTVEAGSVVQLGSAAEAGQWGSVSGSTLAGSGSFILTHGSLVGTLAVEGSPLVSANVAAGQSVDMGGNAGSLISGRVSLAEGATLTGVGSSILDRELNLTLSTANVGNGAAAAAMVVFDGGATRAVANLGSTTEAITLDTSADAVVELLRQQREAGVESYLTLTNGQLITAPGYSNVVFDSNARILSSLGLRIVRVEGGSVVLSGVAQGVYIAGEGEDPTAASGYQNFGAYQAVAVMPGERLTLSLDGAPDPALDGEGALINNLLGAENSALVVQNTNPADGAAVVILNNSLQEIDPTPGGLPGDPAGADTRFGGSISQQGGAVEFVKRGAGTLSVGGALTAHQLTLQAGSVALNGDGNALEVLALEGGAIRLGRGSTRVGSLLDTATGGTMSLAEGATLATSGTGRLEQAQINGSGAGSRLLVAGELTLAGQARLNNVALELTGGTLLLEGTAGHRAASLSGNGSLRGLGTVESVGLGITGTGGSFGGTLAGVGTLTVESGASQSFTSAFTGGEGWALVNKGSVAMDFVQQGGNHASVRLHQLELASGSTTALRFNTDTPAANALTLGSVSVEQGAAVSLSSGGAEELVRSDTRYVIGRVTGGQSAGTLARVLPDRDAFVFLLLDPARTTLSLEADGTLVLNLAVSQQNTFTPLTNNPNSAAGAELLWNAALSGNSAVGTDIRRLLERIHAGGDAAEMNAMLAAVSGSGAAVLSSAFAADVERQLRAIRNRTTGRPQDSRMAGLGHPVPDDMRFSAWVNAEGDHRKLDASGYLPGYSLSSWGGTVGLDMARNDMLTAGLALTAMYGDMDAHSADHARGDFDRYYVSAFVRLRDQRWQHTLLGSAGRLEADLDRCVSCGSGSYRTHGSTHGWGYGLMYELGYHIPLDEDAATTLQPIANVSWRYVDVKGYRESGGDAALQVRGQDYHVVTFGAGARLQTEVGENLFNRRGLLEGRALLKLDAGDREGEAITALLGGGGYAARVRSRKLGAVGVELGAGLSVPLSEDAGFLFLDASAELRNAYSNLNATLGYRAEF